MPAALLKLDENIPDLVAEILGAAGHDAALALANLLSSEPPNGRLWILSDDHLRIWPAEVRG